MVKGGAKPLFYLPVGISLMFALVACSGDRKPTASFFASGYMSDKGVVRIWRKDTREQTSHLRVVLTPPTKKNSEIIDYFWQGGRLAAIILKTLGPDAATTTLHFGLKGDVSFMQWENASQRTSISGGRISMLKFEAERIYGTSNALKNGNIVLKQARWNGDGSARYCNGEATTIQLDDSQWLVVKKQYEKSKKIVSLAWVESKRDLQPLLVTTENLCDDEPTIDEL